MKILKSIDSNVKSIKTKLGKKMVKINKSDRDYSFPDDEESEKWSYNDQEAWKKDFKV